VEKDNKRKRDKNEIEEERKLGRLTESGRLKR